MFISMLGHRCPIVVKGLIVEYFDIVQYFQFIDTVNPLFYYFNCQCIANYSDTYILVLFVHYLLNFYAGFSVCIQHFLFLVYFPTQPCFCYVYTVTFSILEDIADESAFILFLLEHASAVANHDCRILFTLRVLIWINVISSLCVVVSWFAVFVRFFLCRIRLRIDRKVLLGESPCVQVAVY